MIKAILFDWGDTLMKDFQDESGPMYKWKKIEAVDYAEESLAKLSNSIPCYLATNAKSSTKEEIYKALKKVHLEKYIKDVFCYKDIGYSKPTREYFMEILKRLSLKPDEIVMIGDNFENDIEGVKKHGFYAIYFAHSNKSDYNGLTIESLLDIEEAIKLLPYSIA